MSETKTISLRDYSVKLIGVLATAAGRRGIAISAGLGLSLSELISKLVQEVDKHQFNELLIDSATSNPLPNVIILLDDQDCRLFQGLRTQLDPGTRVTIIPVAHGG